MIGKYIITQNGSAITFHESIRHDDFKSHKPTAAGFFRVEFDLASSRGMKVSCWGRSTSLNISSRAIDEALIEAVLFGDNFGAKGNHRLIEYVENIVSKEFSSGKNMHDTKISIETMLIEMFGTFKKWSGRS